MNRRRFHWSAWALLSLALVTTSCERSPNAPATPTVDIQAGYAAASYTLVQDRLPLTLSVADLTTSRLIGLAGGTVSLLGHSIFVPEGAVTTLTTFTITVLPTGYVEVSLLALVPDLFGSLTSVGEKGFNKPVRLSLTYARSPDKLDPSRLLILYVDGTKVEELPSTVDKSGKTVSAELKHFSKYCMASN